MSIDTSLPISPNHSLLYKQKRTIVVLGNDHPKDSALDGVDEVSTCSSFKPPVDEWCYERIFELIPAAIANTNLLVRALLKHDRVHKIMGHLPFANHADLHPLFAHHRAYPVKNPKAKNTKFVAVRICQICSESHHARSSRLSNFISYHL